jgi:hypothetical protein
VNTDPYKIEHHILLIRAIDVPSGISLEPNPRKQNIDLAIYQDIQSSLEENGDPTFHLKNKGITMFANSVEVSEDKKVVTAFLDEDDGIADGGHTYKIILDSQSKNKCPDNQYVKIEIITGVPQINKADITGGLNTAVQVQEASLQNLEGKFDWIKKTLEGEPYYDQISYMQNEKKEFDVRDIIAFLTLFNVENSSLKGRHPKEAYTSKAACLKLYADDSEKDKTYEMLKPLLKDILQLHDYINLNMGKLYNAEKKDKGERGRAHGMEGVFDDKARGFRFIFANEESKHKLFDGALYPIFGALRYLVERKKNATEYSWKLKNFDQVKKFFDSVGAELLTATYNTSLTHGRKPNPIGKDENHWGYLYQIVKVKYMETKDN